MFRRRSAHGNPNAPTLGQSHALQLLALGDLIDEERFAREGLCILASGRGFVVSGFALAQAGLNTSLVQRTFEVTSEMITAAITRRQEKR